MGAALLSACYERNIRIFANPQRISRPGDRIVVIFGSGHAAILRVLVRSAPGMVLVGTNDLLPGSCATPHFHGAGVTGRRVQRPYSFISGVTEVPCTTTDTATVVSTSAVRRVASSSGNPCSIAYIR